MIFTEDEIKIDCSLDKSNIGEELKNISTIRAKYSSAFRKCKTELVKVEVALQQKEDELFIYYNEKYEISLKATEIPHYIRNHEDYKSLYSETMKLRNEMETLKEIREDVNSKSWDIKNIIDYRKQIYDLGGNPSYE